MRGNVTPMGNVVLRMLDALLCRFGRCRRCDLYETDAGIGGKCVRCDRIHGWMTVDEIDNATRWSLCERLACETGDRISTVDVVLWRACASLRDRRALRARWKRCVDRLRVMINHEDLRLVAPEVTGALIGMLVAWRWLGRVQP